jgi:hypothetical protein
VSGKRPNHYHYSHSQPASNHNMICSVEPTLGIGCWRLTSSMPCANPFPAPKSFLEVLQSWGNTWLWEHLQVTGGVSWLHDSIVDGSMVAVTDGSYIRELLSNLCLSAFVLEYSKGCKRIVGTFLEALLVANANRGELLGFMAIQLILLSVNKLHSNLARSVEIVSDCLGALKQVTYLPPYCIPSRCCHSNILKTILVHCWGLSFTTHYSHPKAHQDNKALFANLSQKTQLNCICDHAAKQRIAINGSEGPILGWMLPLEPISIFANGKKMTLETDSLIRFWVQRQLAHTFFHEQKILSNVQFNNIDWTSVHRTMHGLSHLFQIWAAKHVLGIAGTMKFLAHQDDRSPLCPGCLCCEESSLILHGASK